MVELRLLRMAEHETDAATVEERQGAGGEQQRESESVPVKCGGAVEIVYVDCDLAESRNSDGQGCGSHGGQPPGIIVSIATYISWPNASKKTYLWRRHPL